MKLPLNVGAESGYTFIYWDAETPSKWSEGNFRYHDGNAVALTVMQLGLYGAKLAGSKDKMAWAMWNDESYGSYMWKHPVEHWNDSTGAMYGHTKGLLAHDLSAKTGFYLQHSAPAFPFNHTATPDYWHFPFDQSIFAQHFFCTSLSQINLEAVAAVARYYHAFIYEAWVPSHAKSTLPELTALAVFKGGSLNGTNANVGSALVETLGGLKMTIIGKTATFDGDLYEDAIAPQLLSQSSPPVTFQVQTWCCGNDGYCCEPAYCLGAPIVNASEPQRHEHTYKYSSVDVMQVDFGKGGDGDQLTYRVAGNHAKWLVGSTGMWVCMADMNRMITQRLRGGGALCFEDADVHAVFSAAISKAESC